MKVLLITLYYVPDVGPDPPLMSALVKEWIRLGHSVTVVCAFPHYKRKHMPDPYRGKWFEIERPTDGYRIVRTWVYVPSRSKFCRVLNYLSFMLTGGLAALFTGSHDIVVIYAPPPTNGLIGYIVSRVFRCPMIYNVQDIYPDIGVKLGVFKNRHLIRLLQQIENFFYAKSAAITVISDGFRQNLRGKGVSENKLHVIYNWVNTEFIRPLRPMNELRVKKGWKDKFVILYAGNIGLSQGLELLLEVARKSLDMPDIIFVIVGQGEGRRKLESMARAMSLKNIEFHDFLPEEELPYLLACADVSLVMLKSKITSESVPSKVYSIMSSGRPILAVVPPESDTWAIVQEAGAGLCVPPGDEEALLSKLRILYRDEKLRKRLGNSGRQWVVQNCQPDQAALKYHKIFVRLLQGKAYK